MIIIDARCVILNLLRLHESIDRSFLHNFAIEFKKEIHDAYVDISDKAVASFIEAYSPDVVKGDNDKIVRGNDFGMFADKSFLDKTINKEFPTYVRKCIHKSCQK